MTSPVTDASADSSAPSHGNSVGDLTARPFPRLLLLAGWLTILVFCLVFYDALMFHSLRKNIHESARGTAVMAAEHLSMELSTGVRLGKNLASFLGLPERVEEASAAFPDNRGVAVVLSSGQVVHAQGEKPTYHGKKPLTPDGVVAEDASGFEVAAPIAARGGGIAGYTVIRVPSSLLDESLAPLFFRLLKMQLLITAGMAVLLLLLLHLPLWDMGGNLRKKLLHVLCIGSFVLAMAGNGLSGFLAYVDYAKENAGRDAQRLSSLMSRNVTRLLLVGRAMGSMDHVTRYLESVVASMNGTVVLELRDTKGEHLAGGLSAGTEVLPGAEHRLALDPAHHSGWFAPPGGEPKKPSTAVSPAAPTAASPTVASSTGDHLQTEAGATERERLIAYLTVSVEKNAWMRIQRDVGLDMLTVDLAALIFMVEMFLLFFQYLDARSARQTLRTLDRVQRSGLLRPLMFMVIMATDMSISFIPLRMSELLAGGGNFSRDVLMGLPISAEMGMTGLSVLAGGAWMRRKGATPPLTWGLGLAALGCLSSALATGPILFILARGVVGMGYGLAILAAQAYTVGCGKLSDMFAGVYAGSLCGSAMGAILAERLGYAPVFLVSSVALFCLLALPRILLGADSRVESGDEAPRRLSGAEIRRLLGSPRLLAFILLSLAPCAFLTIGFLNYFLPVFLNGAGVPQSDVGRVFMLYCLVFIYLGPVIGLLVHRTQRKSRMVCAGGMAASLAVLSFTLLPPLSASLCGALLLGLATCFIVPAQSEYLLQLDIARAIGVEQTMGMLNALERVGQVLGPLCVGAAIAGAGVSSVALWGGMGFLALPLLFLFLDGFFAPDAGGTGDRGNPTVASEGAPAVVPDIADAGAKS